MEKRMAQTTYTSITREIAALQAQAEAIKKKEAAEVIARIKDAIAQYDLTAKDLGFGGGRGASKSARLSRTAAAGGYADGQGNTWSGHGRRPQWFLEAIAAGKTPEELKVGASAPKTKTRAKPNAMPTKNRGKAAKQVSYSDGTNTWSGRGRRPQWFLDALGAGKTADELRA
jgi:DNA-binding protein H-NS